MQGAIRRCRFILPLLAAVLVGCRDQVPRAPKPSEARAAIFHALQEKSGRREFPVSLDLELPAKLALMRSNSAAIERRVHSLRAAADNAASREQRRVVEEELTALRAQINAAEQELADQENTLIRRVRREVAEAGTYQAIYALIGEQLTAADKLLVSPDRSRRQIGFNFAREACHHALEHAQNSWLAARIAETYLWPHLELADYKPDSKERALDVLALCHAAFMLNEETNHLVRNAALQVAFGGRAQ